MYIYIYRIVCIYKYRDTKLYIHIIILVQTFAFNKITLLPPFFSNTSCPQLGQQVMLTSADPFFLLLGPSQPRLVFWMVPQFVYQLP